MIIAGYSVMVVGHGFMGKHHARKADLLNKTELVAIVDIDPKRHTVEGVPAYTSLEKAFKEVKPNLVSVCTSTKTHFAVLEALCALEPEVHILMEKPFVANLEEAKAAGKLLAQHKGKISGGYLFRQSPIVEKAINYIKEHELTIKEIRTTWQKDRSLKGPPRPSAGVHIDEATHPADLIINCILPECGIDAEGVTILKSSYKRQSDVDCVIVDQKMQEELYKEDPKKLDPVAEVAYELDVEGIPVKGFSSFAKGPQRREVEIETDKTTLFLEFDVNGLDRFSITGTDPIEYKCDKLELEWKAFLTFCDTGKKTYRTQTFQEMRFDIALTEALGSDLEHPHTIMR